MTYSNVSKPESSRIVALDCARGVALIAMALYHFVWDLELFGYLDRATATTGGWKIFARTIAFSFLFLVGISLVLATQNGIRLRPYIKRLMMVGGAALVITIATYFATPDTFIFFGILHHIAFASVLGLIFIFLPGSISLLAAMAIWLFWLQFGYDAKTATGGVMDIKSLAFLGLNQTPSPSNDYVPVVPWFAAVCLGIAAVKLTPIKLKNRAARFVPHNKGVKALAQLGQHSLLFYLLHQPVLIGIIYAASQFVPA